MAGGQNFGVSLYPKGLSFPGNLVALVIIVVAAVMNIDMQWSTKTI
jgi:hypothetical protein